MKTLDKIYLQHNTTTDLYDEFWPEWFEDTNHSDNDICYIRKDILLEWAKEKYNKAYKLHLKKGDNYAYGQGKMDAYGKLIDKLNSM